MNKILIDCGTHLGEGLKKHIISNNVDESWKIYTFEANKNTFDILKNIRDNFLEIHENYKWILWKNISFENKAVWIEKGFLDFYCSSIEKCKDIRDDDCYSDFIKYHDDLLLNNNLITSHHRFDVPIDGSSTIFKNHFENKLNNSSNTVQKNILWKEEDKIKVESFDFSAFLKTNVSPGDYVVCKVDIEGSEFKVLKKCIEEGTLKLINKISIEFHDYGDSLLIEEKNNIIRYLRKNNVEFIDWE